MAQQRIRASRLPEILAQFGRTGPGESIEKALAGFKEGATLASTLAARKQDAEVKKLQIRQIEDKVKASQDKLAGQEKLEAKQKEISELGQRPVTSIPLGPQGKAFPTLSDVALTDTTDTFQPTGQRGQDAVLGLGAESLQTPTGETALSPEQLPTGQTGAELIPGIQQELEAQIPGLQQQAFPEAAQEQAALEAFPKPDKEVSDKDTALTEQARARTRLIEKMTGIKGDDAALDIRRIEIAEKKLRVDYVDDGLKRLHKHGVPKSPKGRSVYNEDKKRLEAEAESLFTGLLSDEINLGVFE